MNKLDRTRLDRLSSLGCVVCRNLGYGPTPSEIHHLIGVKYKGLSQRASHQTTIPLCPEHHRGNHGIHHMGRKAWEAIYGEQGELLEQVNMELGDGPKQGHNEV